MQSLFAGLMLLAATQIAGGQAPNAAPTASAAPARDAGAFTGVHATDLMATAAGAPQPISFCQGCDGPNRYVDLRFMRLKQTAPAQKEPLILFTVRNQQSPGGRTDTYHTGMVNEQDSTGVQLFIGQWVAPDTAYEVGATYIQPFFYKRLFQAQTTQGTAFSGGSSSTVQFLPTATPLDFAYVYDKIYHWGVESNMRRRVVRDECRWLDAIVGLRYYRIDERYNIDVTPVRAVGVKEYYHTSNDMFGLQLGVEGDRRVAEYVSLRAAAKYVVGFNWQSQRVGGTTGASFLTTDAARANDDEVRFGNFADLSLAVVGHLTPNIETSLGVTSILFGGVKRSADLFDLGNLPATALRDGQDSLILYGFMWTVRIDF